MVELRRLKADRDAVENGRWFDYIKGVRLLVGSCYSTRFKLALAAKAAEHELGEKDLETIGEKHASWVIDVLGEHVLLGWEGIDDVEWSPQKSAELLRDPDLDHLAKFVVSKSKDYGEFTLRGMEGTLGNSSSASAGAASGDRTQAS